MTLHQPVWALSIESVCESLETTANGLTEYEAAQRFERYGANELPETAHRPIWLRFTDQLTHFMALLLWIAGILAFVSHTPELGWAIWAVIWINAVFSFSQEYQAERALAALKKVLPVKVRVDRDGELKQIPARELVRGDVMQLEEGDRISADARLISAESLYVDVSVLTGESLPVSRNPHPVRPRQVVPLRGGKTLLHPGEQPLQERVNPAEIANLVLAGSTVSSGRAIAVVYATGAQTEFGQVAHLTTMVKREPSTLEIQVARIVRIITAIACCHKAGIKVTMVTGDYGLTAEAIARNIGLVKERVRVVTGEGMGNLSDAQLRQILKYRGGIVDTHFDQRNRMGRLMTFVARQIRDGVSSIALGIGIDEDTSVVVNKIGVERVMGDGSAKFILAEHDPEVCEPEVPLTFSNYKIWKVHSGNTFDLKNRAQTGFYLKSVKEGEPTSDLYASN
ncbi:cation-transporting P-type ATPase [Scytonema sp. UIC 10036]|uniref:P-type ATPase n=1 Tax=Scytonema sp. UIC 10036 TaxID=2304196 RepID=UPI001FAA95CE|nr:cation-transporting P-type ATPase [Scytonema sp. UIC 10036]